MESLKSAMPSVETISIWFSCDTRDGHDYHHNGLPDDLSPLFYPEPDVDYIHNRIPRDLAQQYGTFWAVGVTLRMCREQALVVQGAAFEFWDTDKETVDLRGKNSVENVAKAMTHRQNKDKQFLL